MERETRSFVVTFETRGDDSPVLIGHAAVFNEWTKIGGWFEERIAPGAFAESIESDDVRALFNHNADYVLGRNTAGTLRMSEDDKGLRVEIDPPDTQWARDLATSIRRGDITQMSFGFETLRDEWEKGEDNLPDRRTLLKVRLWDVSPVTYPAYKGTDIAVRSHEAWAKASAPWRINLKKRHLHTREIE